MLNRRTFLRTSAGVIPLAAGINGLAASSGLDGEETVRPPSGGPTPKLTSLPQRRPAVDPATLPWQQRVRRVGQSNMTEHDPAVMNIEEWADYWHSADVDVVFISVTGILAFYPSKLFDQPSAAQTDGIAGLARGSAVQVARAALVVLGNVRRHVQLPHRADEVLRVVSLVGTHRDAPRAALLLFGKHQQRRIALGISVGVRHHRSGDQTVAVLHQRMPQITQLRLLAVALLV